MRVLDRYDYSEGKERYIGTKFMIGKDEYLGKSHTYSYLMIRNMKKEMGEIMGFDAPHFSVKRERDYDMVNENIQGKNGRKN